MSKKRCIAINCGHFSQSKWLFWNHELSKWSGRHLLWTYIKNINPETLSLVPSCEKPSVEFLQRLMKKIVFKWHERFRIATLYYFVKKVQVGRRLWQTVYDARYCRATYSFILQGAAHPYRRVNYGYIFLNFNTNTGGGYVENVNRSLDLDIKVTSRYSTLTSACFKSYIVLFFNVIIILSIYSCSWK